MEKFDSFLLKTKVRFGMSVPTDHVLVWWDKIICVNPHILNSTHNKYCNW